MGAGEAEAIIMEVCKAPLDKKNLRELGKASREFEWSIKERITRMWGLLNKPMNIVGNVLGGGSFKPAVNLLYFMSGHLARSAPEATLAGPSTAGFIMVNQKMLDAESLLDSIKPVFISSNEKAQFDGDEKLIPPPNTSAKTNVYRKMELLLTSGRAQSRATASAKAAVALLSSFAKELRTSASRILKSSSLLSTGAQAAERPEHEYYGRLQALSRQTDDAVVHRIHRRSDSSALHRIGGSKPKPSSSRFARHRWTRRAFANWASFQRLEWDH